jgi:hypothetical protein
MRTLAAVLALLAAPAAARGETLDIKEASPGAPRPRASVDEMGWLAGQWQGAALGGTVEEVWGSPAPGGMLGFYRLVKDGALVFAELMMIVPDGDSVAIRLKHFNADLTGWEEKAEVRSFPLVARSGGRFYFDGMTFVPTGRDRLEVLLRIGGKDGKNRDERFEYRRVGKLAPLAAKATPPKR